MEEQAKIDLKQQKIEKIVDERKDMNDSDSKTISPSQEIELSSENIEKENVTEQKLDASEKADSEVSKDTEEKGDDSKKYRKKIRIYKKKLKQRDKELKKEKEKYAFLNAELENSRKHFQKQNSHTEKRTVNKTITKFTPLIDSFENAFELKNGLLETTESQLVEEFIKGFEQVFTQLKDIFNYYGLKTIEQAGIEFDYRIHEVMMRIIDDEKPEDTVVQILQKGYERNGEVIKPAKVIVSKQTPPIIIEPPKEEKKTEKIVEDLSEPKETKNGEGKSIEQKPEEPLSKEVKVEE